MTRVIYPSIAALLLAATASCGGSSSPVAVPGLSVGGTYGTRVTLLPAGNTCAAVHAEDNPTIVDHVPGSASLSLTHAGNSYPGTGDRTGAPGWRGISSSRNRLPPTHTIMVRNRLPHHP